MTRRVAVVGGGASGLASAFFLDKEGYEVTLFEAESQLGGRMRTADLDGNQVCLGGKNIGRTYGHFREFVRALGDEPFEYFGLNSSQVIDGRIRSFDRDHWFQSIAMLAKIGTLRDATYVAPMIAAIRRDPLNRYLGGPYFERRARSLGHPSLDQVFGVEFCRHFVRPMAVRMNGAEPNEIYLENFGSNLGMLLDSYEQLSSGFGPLFSTFEKRFEVRLATRVRALGHRPGRHLLETLCNGRTEHIAFDNVVLALPARQSAGLLQDCAPRLAQLLRSVAYYPVATVIAKYREPVFSERVRALVMPAELPLSNAGAYGIHDRHIVRYTFSGAAARQSLTDSTSIEHLLARGEKLLGAYFPVDARARVAYAGAKMSLGLCAYTREHAAFVQNVLGALAPLEGVELAGDYLEGASIEGCFRSGVAAAQRLGLPSRRPIEPQAEGLRSDQRPLRIAPGV